MFQELNRVIREEVVALLYHAEVTPDESQLQQQNGAANGSMSYEHQSLAGAEAILAAGGGTSTTAGGFASGGGAVATPVAPKPVVNNGMFDNVGRNDLCPCGSGKKFKKCHGQ